MKSVNISKVIQQRRTELGLTREQVCEGICSPMTLLRIEQGTSTPSKYILESISQRLGLSLERFSYMLSDEDFELEELKRKAVEHSRQRKFIELKEIAEEIEKHPRFKEDNVLRQFVERVKMASELYGDEDKRDHIELLENTIKLTVPQYSEENIENLTLSKEEIKLGILIANCCIELLKDGNRAISIYKKLLNNVEKNYLDGRDRHELIILLTYNLSRALGRMDYYKEALEVAEKGLAVCGEYGSPRKYADLLMNKGYGLCSIHRQQEGEFVLKTAYNILKLIGYTPYCEVLERDCQNLFGFDVRK